MLVIEKFSEKIKKISSKPERYQCELYELLFNTHECNDLSCQECSMKTVLKLMEEYKEPIVLSKVEYDILISYTKGKLIVPHYTFESFAFLEDMKQKGYFKGVNDTLMSIKEILENCEVVK